VRPSAYLSTAHEDDWNEVLPWTVRVTVLDTTEPRPLVEKWIFSRMDEAHSGAMGLVTRLTVMLRVGGRVGKRQRVQKITGGCWPAHPLNLPTNRAGGAVNGGQGAGGGGSSPERDSQGLGVERGQRHRVGGRLLADNVAGVAVVGEREERS
jgi:hypothetical protein